MRIRTDDEVYRVDAVWLGPPRATFPWRARYSSYAIGLVVMVVLLFLQRRLGISLGFFSVAWALLITVGVTRFVGRRIDEDRPLFEWLTLFWHEVRGPRRRVAATGGVLEAGAVRVRGLPETPVPALAVPELAVPELAVPELAVPDPAAGPSSPPAMETAGDGDFGPPSSITVGNPVTARPGARAGARRRALDTGVTHSAAADVGAWTTPPRAPTVRPDGTRPRRSRTTAPSAVRVSSERVPVDVPRRGGREGRDGDDPRT